MSLIDCALAMDMPGVMQIAKDRGIDYVQKERYNALTRDLRSNNILHIGCQLGFLPLVEYSLDIVIAVNTSNVCGDTPLILAAKKGRLEIVKKLVSAGAEVNHANLHGNTALHYACFWRYNDVALYLAKTCGAIVKVANNFHQLTIDHTSNILKSVLKGIFSSREIGNKQGDQIIQGMKLNKSENIEVNLAEWNTDPNSIQIEETIFESSVATLYKATWKDTIIALKVPIISRSVTDQELQVLKTEITAINKLSHPHLFHALAASVAKDWKLCYLLEFANNGNLETMINDPSIDMSPQDALKFTIQIAKGLVYLHELQPFISHGNLKPSNILVNRIN